MSLFNTLFGWLFNSKNKSAEELLKELETVQQNMDVNQMAKLYYAIGEKYLQSGAEEKAFVYINRFDNLVSSNDKLYERFKKKEEQASDWIGMLEEKDFFAKRARDKVEELSEALNQMQKIQWNLLTLARFNTLLAKFSAFPGFEVLRQYENVIDILTDGMLGGLRKNETKNLFEWLTHFYDFCDSAAANDARNKITVSGRAAFEACDLQDNILLTNLDLILDEMVQIAEGTGNGEVSIDFITAGLLTGYYARTSDISVEDIPAVKTEWNRILSDYEFVCYNPSYEEFITRMSEYKKISLIA